MGIFIKHFRLCSIAVTLFVLGVPGTKSVYGQKYWVTYSISTNALGSSTNQRVLQVNIDYNSQVPAEIQGSAQGSYGSNTIPGSFNVLAVSYASDGSANWDTNSYPLGLCRNTGSDAMWGVSYGWDITVAPNLTTTGVVDQNRVYCPGETIDLSATAGFSSYTWQYAVNSGTWTTIRTTSGNSTQVSSADIGSNYLQNIYFRAIADGCMDSRTTPLGPYKFSPGSVSVPQSGLSFTPPLCKGGIDGKITVSSFNRALVAGEKFIIHVQSPQGNDIGTSLEASSLPVTLDQSRVVGGIYARSYTIYVEAHVGSVVSTCGQPVYTPFTISDYPAVVASASVSSNYNGFMIRCVGSTDGAVTVSGSGGVSGFQYSSDGGTSYQASPVFSGLGAGSYTFRVKDSNGCFGTSAAVSITPPEAVHVNSAYAISDNGSGGHTSCNLNDTGGTKNDGVLRVEASGGSGAFQYSLAGGTYSVAYQGNADVSSLYPDTYSVTVRDANGCVSSDHPTVAIIQPSEIVYTGVVHEDVDCYGIPTGSVELQGASGGIGAFKYSINGGAFQNSNLFETLPPGTVTITISDSKGCTKNATPVVINQPAPFVFSAIDASLQSCTGIADGAISLAPAAGGTAPRQYSVDDQTYIDESATITFSGLHFRKL